jgi:O-acetylhomoserine/O-acetylserine sulfhydrylase-like pyridoxal-dependent enzyme
MGAGAYRRQPRSLYGGSHNLLPTRCRRFGIDTTFVDPA